MRRTIVMLFVVLVLIGAGAAWYFTKRTTAATPSYRVASITRGDLRATIGATGTVEPEEVIDVGAQVAGRVIEFGKDEAGKPVDFGSVIGEGTILARIDDSLYQADLELSKAQLAQANANHQSAVANVAQMTAKLTQAERDWNRAQKLGPSEALAPTTFDAYKSTFDAAKANVAAAEAAVEQTKASITAAQAGLNRVQQLLAYCTITSPVKGVVIDRRVNIGQTVVASLNTPSLFLIARDLTRIQVWISVNEADIGHIHSGQPVAFTVDSFPGQTFHGTVSKVRLNATMTQNVVTYTVEVTTDNSDGRLLPYLTANAQFEIGKREGVLMVPNAALRFTPRAKKAAAEAPGRPKQDTGAAKDARPAKEPGEGKDASAGTDTKQHLQKSGGTPGTVWVQEDGTMRPIQVIAGLSDGSMTEVTGDELKEGMEIVVADLTPAPSGGGMQAGGGSPFVTTPMRGGGGGGGGPRPAAGGRP